MWDVQVFLMESVVEFYVKGHDPREAVRLAGEQTGSAASAAHCCSGRPRATREARAPTAQQTMVSLGDLAPPEKPTGRRYLTGRPDGQEAVWRNPRRYLVPKASKGEPPHGKKALKSPRGGGEISWSRARQFPDRAAQSGYDSPERDFVGTQINRKTIPVPLEETLEHRLGFKGRVRDRRNGIPKVGLKEVVDMWQFLLYRTEKKTPKHHVPFEITLCSKRLRQRRRFLLPCTIWWGFFRPAYASAKRRSVAKHGVVANRLFRPAAAAGASRDAYEKRLRVA